MASQVLSSLLITPQSNNASSINGDTRPLANFPPSTWGDYFLAKSYETTMVLKFVPFLFIFPNLEDRNIGRYIDNIIPL